MDEIKGHIRAWAEIDELGGEDALTRAERRLIGDAVAGKTCRLGEHLPPEILGRDVPDPAVHIRAPILRYLLLGGCANCPTAGKTFEVEGAHITGTLNLDYQELQNPLRVFRSRFNSRLDTTQTCVAMINLSQCQLSGWRAQRLDCEGSVFIRRVKSSAGIDLRGAIIGGQVSFSKLQLDISDRHELIDRTDALNARGLRVSREIIWSDVMASQGSISFVGARCEAIWDQPTSWPGEGRTRLDGLIYDRIINSTTDAKARLEWIAKGETPGRFFPQPYTHLAKVLREMGHERDARDVLIAKERRHNTHTRNFTKRTLDGSVTMGLRSIWLDLKRPLDALLRWVAGYGYAPVRSGWTILIFIVLTYFPSTFAYNAGDFAPNSGVIQVSDGWSNLANDATVANPADTWANTQPGRDWETFDPIIYAADVVIPIINFGQTEAWAPSTTRGPWGWHLWWFKSLMALAGWIVTAIGAAAITGIIRRD
ncbi:MAG: hypothetical protein AAFX45_06780 [Pseudomonadota bacterium]